LATTTVPNANGWVSGSIGSAAADNTLGQLGAAQNFVVGALRLTGAATRQILFANTTNLDTLYVESGGILSDGSNNLRNIGNQTVGSQLTAGQVGVSGNYELFLHNNANTTTIYSNIINNPAGGNVRLVKDLDGQVTLNPTIAISSTTVISTPTVTLTAGSTGELKVGMPVSGTGIPTGATVLSITNATQFVLSANATASGTNSLTYYYLNTYSGGTLHERGTLEAVTLSSLGSGAVTVKNSRLNLDVAGTTGGTGTFGGFRAVDQAEIYLNKTDWGVGGGNILNTMNVGDRFIIEAGSTIIGFNSRPANQNLNALTRVAGAPTAAGQIQLMPDAIIGHQSFTNDNVNGIGVSTIQNLGTAADIYFGLTGDFNPGLYGSVTIGAGTPWKGISTDRNARSFIQGTIYANSDFYLQGLTRENGMVALNLGAAGSHIYSIVNNAGKPINAYVVGQVVLNDDVSPSMPDDLTFVVTPGAIFQPGYSNSLGSPSMYPGTGYADILVQAGGTLNTGNFVGIGWTANQPYNVAYPVPGPLNGGQVTVEAGGRLWINQASGIGSGQAGNITMKTDSIMHLGTANAFFGMDGTTHMINPGQFVYEPGAIIRMETSNVYKMSQFISGEPNGDRVAIEIYNGDRMLTSVVNPFILPAPGSVLIAPENITIANGGMVTNDSNDRTLQEGRGRLILGNGAVLAGTNQTYMNIQEGVQFLPGATITIGTNRWVDGNPKLGAVQFTGPNSNTGDATNTVVVTDGAQLSFGALNVFPDTANLSLPAAVTNWPVAYAPPSGYMPPNAWTGQPGNGSTLLLNAGTGTTNAEVIGALTGNGGVMGNAGCYLAAGWGAASDFTFNGVFKSTNAQNPGLVKVGSTKMTLTNASDSTAELAVMQGELALAGSATTLFGTIRLGETGTLTLDNSSTALNNRLGGKSISGQGGSINLVGNAASAVTETIGTLNNGGTPAGSLSYLNVTPGAATTKFVATTIENFTGGGRQTTWVFRTPAMGNLPGTYDANNVYTPNPANLTNGLIIATNPNLSSRQNVGGQSANQIAGAIGSPVVMMRPDILGTTNPTGQGVGFVTQDNNTTSGFRLLAASEYASTFAPDNFNSLNARLSGTWNGFGDTRIQSLTMTPGSTLNINGTLPLNTTPSRLYLYSPGVLVQSGGTATIGGSGTYLQAPDNCSLYLHTQGNLNLNAIPYSMAGIVKTGSGTLNLGPGTAGIWRGTMTIDDGTVNLAANNSFVVTRGQYTFRGQNLTMNGGTLDLGGNNQIVNALMSANWLPYGAAAGGTITSATPATLTVQAASTFSGVIAGAISLDKVDNTTLLLTNNSTYTGTTGVRQGTVQLRDEGRFSNTSQVDINYATLLLDNGYLANVNDRVNPAATVNMRGGSLNIVGAPGQVSRQNIATLNLVAGQNVFNSNAGGSGATEIIIGNLTRAPGSGAYATFQQNYGFVGAPGNDTTAIRHLITNINGSPLTLTNNLVAPWAIWNGDHFATYSPATGISYLSNTADGYNNYDSGDVTMALPWQNVNDGANRTIPVSRTVNAIRNAPNAANTFTINSGQTLTIASGGILTNNNNSFVYTGGFLTSGTNELDVWVNQNNTYFRSVVADGAAGTVGLVKGGGGNLQLEANNTYTGTTFVDAGTLTLNLTGANATSIVAVPGNLVIHNATVTENIVNQIRNTADVTLYSGGVLQLMNAAVTERLNSLTLINNGGGGSNTLPVVQRSAAQASAILELTGATAITAVSTNSITSPYIHANVGSVNFVRGAGNPQTIDVTGTAASPLGLFFYANIGTVPTGISEGGLIKTGTGMLALGGTGATQFGNPATATDVFNVQQGIVRVDAANALGTLNAVTTVQNGAALLSRGNNVITGSIRLKQGSTLGTTEGDATFGTATTTIASQSLLNVAGDSTICVGDYFLQGWTQGYTINLNSKLTGSANINVIGPQMTSATGTLRLGNNITDDPAVGGITAGANDYSGTITLNKNTILLAQATATAVAGNELGTATVNLNGGQLQLRDNSTGSSTNVPYGNNVILSANSLINANNAGANTGNTVTLGTLTVQSGSQALTTTFTTGDNFATAANNSYQLAFASLDGPGTLVKGGHQVINISSIAPTFSGNIEIAGPQGMSVQPSANLRLNAAVNNINNLTVNGIFSPTASTALNVAGTLRVGDNAGQVVNGTYGVSTGSVTGAMSVPNTATVTANVLDNSGIIGSTGGGVTLQALAGTMTIQGRGLYQTSGQALTLVGSLADGTSPTVLKVAGDNTVNLNAGALGTSTGGTQVQSGTLRVAPTVASTNPLGTGTINVYGYTTPTVAAPLSATLQLDATAGAMVQNSNIVNSGLVRVSAGTVTVGGTISGPGANAYVPGLLEGMNTTLTWNSASPVNPGTFGIKLEPRMGNVNVITQDPITGWGNNQRWVYSGQFYDADGSFSFAANIDDNTSILIDGNKVMESGGSNSLWSTATTVRQSGNTITAGGNAYGGTINFGMGPNGDGWHNIEVRFQNGTGGAGAYYLTGNGMNNNFGFGLNTDGTRALDGSLYTRPIDPGDASLFRTPLAARGNIQLDSGATLNLTATGASHDAGNLIVSGSSGSAALRLGNGSTFTAGNVSIPNAVTLNASAISGSAGLTITGNLTGTGGTLNLGNANLTFNSNAAQSSTANTSGTGNFTKLGTGTLTLTGNGTYSGSTDILAGTVRLAGLGPVSGAALWLDANDLSTITMDGSGRVSQWSDKSGNVRNATQATATQQPLSLSNALVYGQSVMRFDGADDVMSVDLSFLAPNNRYTMFIVEGRLGNKSDNYFLGTDPGATNQGLHVGYRNDTTYTLAQYGNDVDSGGLPGYASQVFRLWSNELDNTGRYVFLDGVQTATSANTTGMTTANAGVVGSGFGGRRYLGELAELILYNAALSTNDRQAVETYLRAKWLGGGLPAPNFIPNDSPVTIAQNAILDINNYSETIGGLAGGGTVLLGTGTLTVRGAISPGDGGLGILTVNGTGSSSLVLDSNGRLLIEIQGISPAIYFDQLLLSGPSFNIVDGALLDVLSTGYYPDGQGAFTVVDLLNAAASTTGRFRDPRTGRSLLDGDWFADQMGMLWQISYFGGTGNDITLKPTPEPGTLVLLGMGAVGLALRRRRNARRA
jgi:autotransporter-associated beta strand protein